MLRSMISDTNGSCIVPWITFEVLILFGTDVPHLHRGPYLHKSGRTIADSQLLGLKLLTHWDPHSLSVGLEPQTNMKMLRNKQKGILVNPRHSSWGLLAPQLA